jgi:hypothetical protein
LANSGLPPAKRQEAARLLASSIKEFGELPPRPEVRRLAILQKLILANRQTFQDANASHIQAMAALVLAKLHDAVHVLLVVDASAKNKTIAEYEKKNKAAKAASQAIVIYPTDRPYVPTRKTGG